MPIVGPAGKGIGYFADESAAQRYAAAYEAATAHLPPGEWHSLETSHGLVRARSFTSADAGDVPLLLLSGRNAGTPSWAPALPALLALGRPIIALDSVGEVGCSVQTASLDDSADQATWVAESVHRLGLGRVHLVAHSLGGWVATHVARHRPDVLASIAVLDPPATFARLSIGFSVAGLASVALPMPGRLRRRLLGWIAGGSLGAGPVPGAGDLEELGLVGLQTFRVRQSPPARPAPGDLRVDGLPALAVFGGRSRVHDSAAAGRAAGALGWQVEVWPDAGHTLHVDFPDRLAERVRLHVARAE